MNRKHLYLASTMTRRGPSRLRLLKEDAPGGSQAAPAANAGDGPGNVGGDSGVAGSAPNNTGATFDPATFWQSPAPAGEAAPAGESAGNKGGESDTNVGEQLTTQLNGLKFDTAIFTPEITEQINNGDFSGVQKNFEAGLRMAVQQSMAMNVQLLRPVIAQLTEQFQGMIDSKLSSRDNESTLQTDFPAAKDPVVAQTIQPIFDRALVNTKGDRKAAVQQTKQMLQFLATGTAGDLGLDVAPADPHGRRSAPGPATNWLDTLTGR